MKTSAPQHRAPRPATNRQVVGTNERGLTLVEVMLASTVFIIAVLAIANMGTDAIGMLRQNADTTMATNLASNTAEELTLLPFDEVSGQSEYTFYDSRGVLQEEPEDANFTLFWDANPSAYFTDVTVQVWWRKRDFAPTNIGQPGDHHVTITSRVNKK